MVETNPFGLDYESRLIALLLRDRHFFHIFLSIFDHKFLVSEIHGTVLKLIQAFKEHYLRPPDKIELEVIVHEYLAQEFPEDKAAQEYALYKYEIDRYFRYSLSELEFVKDNALKYAQQRACQEAVLASAKLIGSGEAYKMPDLLKKALAVGTELTDFGIDYFTEARQRALKRYNQPREATRIPFFVPKFDETVGGVGFRSDGSGIPELLMFGGGENKGKSRCVAHMAKVAISLGLNGIIFTSEMAEDLYAERMDMQLALLDTAGIYDPDNFDRLQRRIELFANQGAKFWIKKFPAGTATIRETLSICNLIESTIGIDLQWVAWDYTSEFRAENTRQERHHQVAEIIRAQKMACDELECAGIGAFQLNREGSEAEMARLTNAAEDITVARVADIIIMIAQTDDEYNMQPPEMRWMVRKNRAQEKNQLVRLIDRRDIMLFQQHPDEPVEEHNHPRKAEQGFSPP